MDGPSLILPGGGGQRRWVETVQRKFVSSGAAPGANLALFSQLDQGRVSDALLLTTMTVEIVTASGNIDLGIYDSADGGVTLTRRASTGSTVAAGASAMQTVALTTPYLIVPGVDYWLAFSADNGTVSIFRGTTTAAVGLYRSINCGKPSTFPLPATVTGMTGQALVPWIEASI